MIHKATNLITEVFDDRDIKYRVVESDDASIVEAGFSVTAGPQIIARFISNDEDNDVAVRVFSLICRVPEDRRASVLEACNTLSGKIRFFKFYLNADNDVNMEADLPVRTDDGCVGECCFELFVRIMSILDSEFHILAEALYNGANTRENKSGELIRLLNALRDKPLNARNSDEGIIES